MATRNQMDQLLLKRLVLMRYELDQLEAEQLARMLVTTDKAYARIISWLEAAADRLGEDAFSVRRARAMAAELEGYHAAIKAQLYGDIQGLTDWASQWTASQLKDVFTFGGALPGVGFNLAQVLQPGQVLAMLDTTLGAGHLDTWLANTFDNFTTRAIQTELMSGLMTGDSIRRLSARLLANYNLTRVEAINLARTYTQATAVHAMDQVINQNRDLVKARRWDAVMERGSFRTGRGTCLRCAALDGRIYREGEKRPPMPLHVRCRCIWVPVVDWASMGVDVSKIPDRDLKPYAIRVDKAIGAGGVEIEEAGTFNGDFKDFFWSRDDAFRRAVAGPRRLDLLKSGKVSFDDLVDPKTGRLKLLNELPGGTGRPGGGKPPAPRKPKKPKPPPAAPPAAPLPKPEPIPPPRGLAHPNLKPYYPLPTAQEAKNWVLAQGLAQRVDFDGLDLRGINDAVASLYYHKQRFGDAINIQYFGGFKAWNAIHETEYLPKLRREYFRQWPHKTEKDWKQWAKNILNQKDDSWATHWSQTNYLGVDNVHGVVLGNKAFADWDALSRSTAYNVTTGFHPPGGETVKAIIDHELGHHLHYRLWPTSPDIWGQTSNTKRFEALFDSLGKSKIKKLLSTYGAKNFREMMAEAWTEYINAPQPRDLARQIGEAIEFYMKEH